MKVWSFGSCENFVGKWEELVFDGRDTLASRVFVCVSYDLFILQQFWTRGIRMSSISKLVSIDLTVNILCLSSMLSSSTVYVNSKYVVLTEYKCVLRQHQSHLWYKKLSYRRETARRTVSVEILSTVAQMCEKITLAKACSRWMTTMPLSCTVSKILSFICQNLKTSRDAEHTPFGGNISCVRLYELAQYESAGEM